MNEKLLKIINHYGVNPQQRQFNEECYELLEAITEYKYVEVYKGSPAEKHHKEHIIEEIADVQVLLNQFKLYYGIADREVKRVMIEKLERQMERIENEEQCKLT